MLNKQSSGWAGDMPPRREKISPSLASFLQKEKSLEKKKEKDLQKEKEQFTCIDCGKEFNVISLFQGHEGIELPTKCNHLLVKKTFACPLCWE